MRTLIIAAHPDDEVLGAGATVSAMSQQGAHIHIHILAEGVSLRHEGMTIDQARNKCALAAKELGAAELSFGGYAEDGQLLADLPQRHAVDMMSHLLRQVAPEIVFTHHVGDIHADHRRVARAVSYGSRILGSGSVRQVLHFEVLSSTEQQAGLVAPFIPNLFYDVSGHVDAKCRALSVYSYELHDPPHPRSLDAVRILSAYRGTQAGVQAAEAFVVGRELRVPQTASARGSDER